MLDIVTMENGIAVLAVHGNASVAVVRGAVKAGLIDVQQQGYRRILIDVLQATGLGMPSVIERVDTVREWASIAVPGLSIAFVADDALLDDDRIGMVVASQLGLNAGVFTAREDGVAWLRRQRLFHTRRADMLDVVAEESQG
ncbi:hypothetical protein DWG18_11880 [Lysobacter sp. TY2-98]|uniref:hypothetical protein n=1 Tax=Lysobacter sp. TY2-98 TaxID=2290922 RepID=UPI000E20B8C1|nr:hypothetical protein [Lysobacter sp. TY2-98]AXK72905.1 hypothetical protein DWG18_11880 [Lysobacter sp. TY2-98]